MTKVAEYTYDAWGNCTITLNTSGYGSRNPFRYRGYYFDSDLGMYYLTTRYYDPKTGRFINADSIEYLDPKAINGLNLYAYCRNNPIMYFDPTGQFVEIILATMITSFAVAVAIALIAIVGSAIKVATKAVAVWGKQLYNDILDFLKSLSLDNIHEAVGAPSNGSQQSSNIKNLYELYGGPGADLKEAIYEEYGIDCGWDN